MKRREQLAWLLSVTLIATMVDLIVISSGVVSTARWLTLCYLISGWFVVWGFACFLVLKSFLLSIASVLVIATLEDVLFLVVERTIKGVPIYPLYCHQWMTRIFGGVANVLALDWFGVPSSYFIFPAVAVLLVCCALMK